MTNCSADLRCTWYRPRSGERVAVSAVPSRTKAQLEQTHSSQHSADAALAADLCSSSEDFQWISESWWLAEKPDGGTRPAVAAVVDGEGHESRCSTDYVDVNAFLYSRYNSFRDPEALQSCPAPWQRELLWRASPTAEYSAMAAGYVLRGYSYATSSDKLSARSIPRAGGNSAEHIHSLQPRHAPKHRLDPRIESRICPSHTRTPDWREERDSRLDHDESEALVPNENRNDWLNTSKGGKWTEQMQSLLWTQARQMDLIREVKW